MKFSFVIPVYNAEQYLDACVGSIISQTYSDYEIILVDDGATDRSGMICDQWAAMDQRVRVLHTPNAGASAARNDGVAYAEGDYIIFLDADDFWLADDVLSEIVNRIAKTNADVLSFNFCKVFADGKRTEYFSSGQSVPENTTSLQKLLERDLWVSSPWNKAIRREVFANNKMRFREGIVSEDIDWSLRLALAAERFDYLDKHVVGYRQRIGSVSGSMTLAKTQQLCENVQECVRLLADAKEDQQNMLKPYVAYQYGTLLHNVSMLPRSAGKTELISQTKEMAQMLNWSNNLKLALIRRMKRVLGFEWTLGLLSIRGKWTSIQSRRSD